MATKGLGMRKKLIIYCLLYITCRNCRKQELGFEKRVFFFTNFWDGVSVYILGDELVSKKMPTGQEDVATTAPTLNRREGQTWEGVDDGNIALKFPGKLGYNNKLITICPILVLKMHHLEVFMIICDKWILQLKRFARSSKDLKHK